MNCAIRKIDSNGVITVDPVLNSTLNYIDSALEANEAIDASKILRGFNGAGLLKQGNQLNTYKSARSIEAIAELNGMLMTSYGATKPPFIIRALIDSNKLRVVPNNTPAETILNKQEAGYDYYVTVDENALAELQPRMALRMNSAEDIDEFLIEAFNTYLPVKPDPIRKFNPDALEAARQEEFVVRNAVAKQTSELITKSMKNGLNSKEGLNDMPKVAPGDVAGQVAFFQTAFAKAGINVVFEYDTELETKGTVINDGDGPVKIVLNPLKMTADTHIHEFGHILIELLGAKHPSVAAAIEELRETRLYEEIKKAYPELSQEDLDKEVVVTAIGLAGAKINRKSPNLFQRIINRIFRALSNKLGTQESAVEKLADLLMGGQFQNEIYQKPLGHFTANSKEAFDNLKERFIGLKDDVKVAIIAKINQLERSGEPLLDTEISRLRLMRDGLDKITQIEQLSEFLDYAVGLSEQADRMMTEISKEYEANKDSMPEQRRLELMNKLHTVAKSIKDFYGESDFENPKNSLMGKLYALVEEKSRLLKDGIADIENNPAYKRLNDFEQRISKATSKMGYIAGKYHSTGIPMLADLYLEYHTPGINDELDAVIKNIEDNKRLISLKKDADYEKLADQYEKKIITKEEFEEAKIRLNVHQLKNLKIGRETLIRELTEAQKDKTSFSYLLDPLVYSSQVSLQLFSVMLKNKFYEANEDTQTIIYQVGEALTKYSETKGSAFNVNKFNEDILEEHEYYEYDRETGKKKLLRVLTFVQPLDVTKYKRAEHAMYTTLNKKYSKPEIGTDELRAWKSTVAAKEYYKEVAEWYKENSVESPDSKAALQKLLDKKAAVEKEIADARTAKNSDRLSYFEGEKAAINASISLIYDPVTKQFKNGAVQPNPKLYSNPKYEALQKNAPALEYYNSLFEIYKASQKQLGKTNQVKNSWETISYAVPSILSDALEKVQRNGAISTLKLEAKNAVGFLSTDTNYGDLINANKESSTKLVPIFYTAPTDEKLVSRDIASSIIQFAGMSNMFKAKSQLHGTVTMMRDAVKEREVLTVNASNNPIIHSASKMLNKTRLVTKERGGNNYKHLEEFIDTVFYGEEDIKQNFTLFGRELSSNKLAGKLASYTAMNNLAFNMLQVTNQLLLDNIRLTEEGISGQFMSMKDLAWAKSQYHLSLGGVAQIKDAGKIAPQTKIVQAVEYFDALQNVLDVANTKKSGPRALKMLKEIPMGAQKLVENETAVTRMLGIMHAYSGKLKDADGKIILNEEGKPANVWDVFIKNEKTGRYEIDPKVANAKEVKRQISQRISGLTKKTNQVKNKFDDAVLQRRSYGKLIMLFRRYFMPTLRRYWGHQGFSGGIHRDMELGVLSEGVVHTTIRLLRDTLTKHGNIVSAYSLMTEMEKQNIKRSGVQAFFFIAAALIAMGLAGDDDDEEQSYAEQFTLYQALRLKAELAQFYNPKEFLKMVESPMASLRTINASIDLLDHIATEEVPYLISGDEDGLYYERKSGLNEKGDSKFAAKVGKLIPIVAGASKSATPEEASKWFTLGAGSGK